jgi:hypothetical protein
VALYVLWATDVVLTGTSGIRTTTLLVLALGFVASAVAVVPGFDELLHGNKAYLGITSALGVAALVAGVVAVWSASGAALAVLVGALVTLWLVATTHHVLLTRRSAGHEPEEAVTAPPRDRVGAA